MPLQYLPASIRTIFVKAAAAPDDALRSHDFKETEINWEFDISQLLLQSVSLQDSAGLERDFFLLVLGCSHGPPALPQAVCCVSTVSPT